MGCTNTSTTEKTTIDGKFVHVVMFWLEEPNNNSVRSNFENALNIMVKDSKYINSVHIGSPANTPRDIVDNSYTYSYIATFNSKEDQDNYQTEAAHDTFRKAIDGMIDKIVIYDSLAL